MSYSYDQADHILKVANVGPGSTTISSYGYLYDPVGNRTRVVESTGNRVTWVYDTAYQLRNERRSGSNSYNITYVYDPAGNRSQMVNGGASTTYTYDAANELLTSKTAGGTTTNTWDADGNLLGTRTPANQRTTYSWDFENRMNQAALSSGTVDTFTFNGDGDRVQRIDSTGTSNFVLDGQNALLETNASQVVQVVYTLEPMPFGLIVSQRSSGATSYYAFDVIGSTTQLTDSTGSSVLNSYLYDSFGNVVSSQQNVANPFQFTGREACLFDGDLNFVYMRARSYNPTVGRFSRKDPLKPNRRETNRYTYALNRPNMFTDPSGWACVDDCDNLCDALNKWLEKSDESPIPPIFEGTDFEDPEYIDSLKTDGGIVLCCQGQVRSCVLDWYITAVGGLRPLWRPGGPCSRIEECLVNRQAEREPDAVCDPNVQLAYPGISPPELKKLKCASLVDQLRCLTQAGKDETGQLCKNIAVYMIKDLALWAVRECKERL